MSKPRPKSPAGAEPAAIHQGTAPLLADLRQLIEQARRTAAAAVNAGLTLAYWRIGHRIRTEVLGGQRAGYGEEIVATLSRQLAADYGRGFEEKNLRRMMQFAELFPSEEIVVSLIRHLSWTHLLVLLPVKDALARDFYSQMCQLEGWSVRTLRERVNSLLYERTALSHQPEALIRQELGELNRPRPTEPAMLLKDPYVLDFLGLQDRHLEKDLEDAILRELEAFLLELGAGFSFVARQRRIQLDNDDFYIDLLFYNRKLRRLVAIELKLGEFRAEYKGQMELYLRWLARHDQEPGDAPPIGIILCTGKKQEQIELLELDKSGIHVAEYLTVLPPREVFERKIHEAMRSARVRLESRLDGQTD
ncbi:MULTISPECIES: PDDEXK nuclease domain-containing protein [unclassified Variovorax]|uniref:PDDEXK nuclease domain-containing protein n=1 Tax=unclassified Variovorax TaxID=663243 RepID=UPI003F48A061